MFLATAGTRTGLSKSAWRWATTFLFSGVQIGMRFFPYEDTNGGSARSNISTLRDRNHQCLSLPRVAADSRAETVDKNKKKKKRLWKSPLCLQAVLILRMYKHSTSWLAGWLPGAVAERKGDVKFVITNLFLGWLCLLLPYFRPHAFAV